MNRPLAALRSRTREDTGGIALSLTTSVMLALAIVVVSVSVANFSARISGQTIDSNITAAADNYLEQYIDVQNTARGTTLGRQCDTQRLVCITLQSVVDTTDTRTVTLSAEYTGTPNRTATVTGVLQRLNASHLVGVDDAGTPSWAIIAGSTSLQLLEELPVDVPTGHPPTPSPTPTNP